MADGAQLSEGWGGACLLQGVDGITSGAESTDQQPIPIQQFQGFQTQGLGVGMARILLVCRAA